MCAGWRPSPVAARPIGSVSTGRIDTSRALKACDAVLKPSPKRIRSATLAGDRKYESPLCIAATCRTLLVILAICQHSRGWLAQGRRARLATIQMTGCPRRTCFFVLEPHGRPRVRKLRIRALGPRKLCDRRGVPVDDPVEERSWQPPDYLEPPQETAVGQGGDEELGDPRHRLLQEGREKGGVVRGGVSPGARS
eukprot:scaffold322473_cov28-Tisochrysis_lutea.AAC.3